MTEWLQVSSAAKLNEALNFLELAQHHDPHFDNFDRIMEPLFLKYREVEPLNPLVMLNVAVMHQSKLYCSTSGWRCSS